MSLEELNALYLYLKEEVRDGFKCELIKVNFIEKIIGCTLYDKVYNSGKKHITKTFYDIHYKIGSDELEITDALKLIQDTVFASRNEGYTSKLRKEVKLDEKFCERIKNLVPSMTPIIYSAPVKEWVDVDCFDITSAYPYLMTQPLPHYDRIVDFKTELLSRKDQVYFGSIEIKNVRAKKQYYPLTLVGKNELGITIEKQGQNIVHRGKQLISADKVVIAGFISDLIEILERNYEYESYKVSKKVVQFNLKIDVNLREMVLTYFERKQEKKRRGESYCGEKVLLNRLYGFLITHGINTPAHYGQYVVSQERLIIDRIVAQIDFKDLVHCHTDSIKFVGDYRHVIENYNNGIEFPELGRFILEHRFQKCVYYSHITAKYLDENGKVGIKHGGIAEIGIKHLLKMKYEDINDRTKFLICKSYFYLKDEGYYMDFVESDFSHSVNIREGE